jgi:signal peptidase I
MATSNRRIFEDDPQLEIHVEGKSDATESNILLTISSLEGQRTVLIREDSITESPSSIFLEAPPERVKTPKQQSAHKIVSSAKWLGYVATALVLTFSTFSYAGVMKARIVLTGSMSPAIKAGDMIITLPVKYHEPKKGEVVAYTARRFNGDAVAVFSHRIIGGDAKDGFIVKGDSNKSPDVQKPKLNDITGTVIFIIPYIGTLLTRKALFLIVPCIFGFWLIIDAMRDHE